jgi:hypothetical protein
LRRARAAPGLARCAPDEPAAIDRATSRAADAVEMWISAGVNEVMNTFNRAED